MPTILASAILDKVEIVLQDVTNVRWAASELLGWLNDAQREIAAIKPDASVVTKAIQLVAGTKQTLGSGSTADAIMLLKVTRNMGTTGAVAGSAIRVAPVEVLDAFRSNWHSSTPSTSAQNFVFDPRSPRQFYVYPPNTGTGYVEVMYSAVPAAIAATSDPITINDSYATAMIDYVLYRAYSKDSNEQGNGERAVAHYQAYQAALGLINQVAASNNPNLQEAPFTPGVPGAAS